MTDKKGKILIKYYCPTCKPSRAFIDLTTHHEIDPGTLAVFTTPKTNRVNDIADSLKRINFDFGRFNPANTGYKIELWAFPPISGRCGSPLGGYLTFYKKEKIIDSYIFLCLMNQIFLQQHFALMH